MLRLIPRRIKQASLISDAPEHESIIALEVPWKVPFLPRILMSAVGRTVTFAGGEQSLVTFALKSGTSSGG